MAPPNNLKAKRNSSKYRYSRIPDHDMKKALDRWETQDLQQELDEAEPVDLESLPTPSYGDSTTDEEERVSFEYGQLGGKHKHKRSRKNKNKKNASKKAAKRSNTRKHKHSGGKRIRTQRRKRKTIRKRNK